MCPGKSRRGRGLGCDVLLVCHHKFFKELWDRPHREGNSPEVIVSVVQPWGGAGGWWWRTCKEERTLRLSFKVFSKTRATWSEQDFYFYGVMWYHFTTRWRSFALRAHQNKPAPCASSATSGVASTEPSLRKQGYNGAITLFWTTSSNVKQGPGEHTRRWVTLLSTVDGMTLLALYTAKSAFPEVG